MSLTYEERGRLADTAQRIQRFREMAAKMRFTVELTGADLRVIRRALMNFAAGTIPQGVSQDEATAANELVHLLSSATVPDLARTA